jgi:hypothetical protein
MAPSVGAWVSGNYLSASGVINWTTTTNNQVMVTDVQLEAGAVATPFERRSYGQELVLCQRYYESGTCLIQLPAAASAIQNIKFAAYKRAVPTMVASNQNYNSASGMQSNGVYQDSFGMALTASVPNGYGSCTWSASCEL